MKNWIFVAGLLAGLMGASQPAEARGAGKFLGGMLARGAVSAAAHSGSSSSSSASSSSVPIKSYTPDTLTVSQLAQCLKGAARLDETSERLEADRSALRASDAEIDQAKAGIEQQRASLNRQSKSAVNAFNASVNRFNALLEPNKAKRASFNSAIDAYNVEVNSHNGECAKKYFASDLPEAKKIAGITVE